MQAFRINICRHQFRHHDRYPLSALLQVFKIIQIHPLQCVRLRRGHADVVFDHQGRKPPPVDQDDPLRHLFDVFESVPGEKRCGNEDAPVGVLLRQAPRKFHDLRATNAILPTLRLDVQEVQAQLVLLDDAVDSAVARFADNLPGVFNGAAISHRNEKVHHDFLEGGWRAALDRLQQLGCQCLSERLIAVVQRFFGRLLDLRCLRLRSSLHPPFRINSPNKRSCPAPSAPHRSAETTGVYRYHAVNENQSTYKMFGICDLEALHKS